MKHDFHFVLTKNLKNYINCFARDKGIRLSEAVVYIFNFMKPILEKHFLKDVLCEISGYSCVDADTDMHVYFEETEYRYLKQIQSNLYCYSMALVLRWVLNEFFSKIKKYGFDRFCKVVRRFGFFLMKRYKKNNFSDKNKFLEKRHLYASIHNFHYISHIFDKEYNLITTKFT